jgi:hypothetical protein
MARVRAGNQRLRMRTPPSVSRNDVGAAVRFWRAPPCCGTYDRLQVHNDSSLAADRFWQSLMRCQSIAQ